MCNPITTKEPPLSTKLPRLRSQALARAAQSGFPRLRLSKISQAIKLMLINFGSQILIHTCI